MKFICNGKLSLVLAVTVMGAWCSATQADTTSKKTLASVEKEILDKWSKIQTLKADSAGKVIFKSITDGRKIEVGSTGTVEYRKLAGKELFRIDAKSQQFVNGTKKFDTSGTTISDGKFTSGLSVIGSEKRVLKQKVEALDDLPGGKTFLTNLKRMYDFSLLPDDTLEKNAVYVLGAVPKKGPRVGVVRMKLYFDKTTGVLRQRVGVNSQGENVHTVSYKNFKIDVPIDSERFVFKMPKNVEVIDRTGKK